MRLTISDGVLDFVLVVALFPIRGTSQENYALCDDCWCIPESGETCPYDTIPATTFSDALVNNLLTIQLENPMTLSCDPYYDSACDTVPAKESGNFCAAEILTSADQCPNGYSYRLITVASREDAEASNLLVTHEGACGTCSTLQDLAIYMTKPDLAEAGTQCAFRSISNFTDGIACYREIGFSESCAAIWVYNTNYTRAMCLSPCLQHASSGLPNNLPAPGCELAECIQCDEDMSGPLFDKFAGRTRRNSGLLSTIVRACDSVTSIVHQDPCESSSATEPTSATEPPSASHQSRGLAVLTCLFALVLSLAMRN